MTLKQTVNQIKRAASCVDVARLCGLPINRPGDRCASPFHRGTSNTSFVCYQTHWVAWSDDRSGDCIDLYAELRCGSNKGKAIRELAERYGITLTDSTAQWEAETQRLCDQAQYYHSQLRAEDREYLHGRGITDATIDALKLGYHSGGITIPYYKLGYVYDITTRMYQGEPRYRRLPDRLDTDPWGINTLGRFVRPVWLVEGTFDAITVFQQGDAVLVTTKPPVDTIDARNIILCYDNDDTGQRYTASVAEMLMRASVPFSIAQLADSKDLNEYYVKYRTLPPYVNGMQWLAAQCRGAEDIKRFVNRHTPDATFREFLSYASIPDEVKKALIVEHGKPPMDSTVAAEVVAAEHPIYLLNDAFYRFSGRIWERMDDAEMKQVIHRTLDWHTTQARINSILGVLKAECLRMDITMNDKPIMTFRNGTLELDTGIFRDSLPEDYASIVMDYAYDASAPCPMWEQFISQVTDGDGHREELLQYIAGYVLFPDCRHQKIFVLLGSGGNGKSVYLDVLTKLYGEGNVSHLEPHDLAEKFNAIHLKDSLLNLATEINDRFTESAQKLKAIAAGEPIKDSYKGKDIITFEPRAKLVFACNEMPSSEYVRGLDRRLMFCDFPMKFVDYPKGPGEMKKDINLIPKLLTELPGIFNWAYKGYRALMAEGEFGETYEQGELMQQFKEVSDPVVAFAGEFVPTSEFMPTEDVYEHFCDWCRRTNNRLITRQKFTEKFTDAIKPYSGEKVRQRTPDGQRRGFRFAPEYVTRELLDTPVYWSPGVTP